MRYGLPYKGSKSRICDWLLDQLPEAETLVDLFFGGGAVTHKALLTGKYKRIVVNDRRGTPQFFIDCVKGKYHDEKRWVSRGDFFRLKDVDPYVACCWSFGNDWASYMYGKDIEPYKKACHYAIVFDEWELFDSLCPEVTSKIKQALADVVTLRERRLAFGKCISLALSGIAEAISQGNPLYDSYKKSIGGPRASPLICLERMQSLEALERMQSLEALELLSSDYREVVIPKNSVVYCDPPYANSIESYGGFNTDAFLDWCVSTQKLHQDAKVYISEYNIDDDRFELVAEKSKIVTSAAKCSTVKIERLYRVK